MADGVPLVSKQVERLLERGERNSELARELVLWAQLLSRPVVATEHLRPDGVRDARVRNGRLAWSCFDLPWWYSSGCASAYTIVAPRKLAVLTRVLA